MRIGDRILDRYYIERLAGSGAMGVVFRGIDLGTERPVAIKLLRDPWSEALPRFQREAEMLAGLSDPRIVRYLAHGMSREGEPFLVMEWLEGETLDQRISRTPLTGGETLAVGRAVAEALVCAHRHGIVHRDLKPANVFLVHSSCHDVRVVDFGIARVRKPGQTLTATGEILGTPAYMSPEQAAATRELDPRSDLFSLGSMIFECLSGRTPFDRPTVLALLIALGTERAPLLRSVAPEVPPRVAELVDAMLSSDPAGRPSDAVVVARAFDAALRDPANAGFIASPTARGPSPRSLTLTDSFASGPTLSPTDSFASGPTLSPTTSPPAPRVTGPVPTPIRPSTRSRAAALVALVGLLGTLAIVGATAYFVPSVHDFVGSLFGGSAAKTKDGRVVADEDDRDCHPALACTGIDVSDPTEVDAFALLPQVIRFARSIRPGAEYVNAVVFGVKSGTIDLDRGSTMMVTTSARISIQVKGHRMYAWNVPGELKPNPLPQCSLAKAYRSARSAGLPGNVEATVTAQSSNASDKIIVTALDGNNTTEVLLGAKTCEVTH